MLKTPKARAISAILLAALLLSAMTGCSNGPLPQYSSDLIAQKEGDLPFEKPVYRSGSNS